MSSFRWWNDGARTSETHPERESCATENTRIDGAQHRIGGFTRRMNSRDSAVLVGGIAFTFPLAGQGCHGWLFFSNNHEANIRTTGEQFDLNIMLVTRRLGDTKSESHRISLSSFKQQGRTNTIDWKDRKTGILSHTRIETEREHRTNSV